MYLLTFLGLYYRDASLITLDLVVIGINIPKFRSDNSIIISYKKLLSKIKHITDGRMGGRADWP